MNAPVVVDRLTVRAGASGPAIIEDVSLTIEAGEIVGVVGESGSGKTTLGLALLGFGRDGATITGGDVRITGRSVVHDTSAEVRRLRGGSVAYVPQDPATSLNPVRRIGAQLREVIALHRSDPTDSVAPTTLITSTLREMGLPDNKRFLRRYPHELSGGQQQRVLLALAFVCEPSVVVLDEPTTGLDTTTQARVLETVRAACRRHRIAGVFISHDLDVVATLASRVLVMYAGRLAEVGPTVGLYRSPRHPYTAALLAASPELDGPRRLVGIPGRAPGIGERGDGCSFAPRCDRADESCGTRPGGRTLAARHAVYCHHPLAGALRARGSTDVPGRLARPGRALCTAALRARHGSTEVLHGVDLEVRRGECVALVGESGSGKTTLSQCITGLRRPSGGGAILDGRPLAPDARDRAVEDRRALQYIFQNPFGSLNPRRTVAEILAQPATALGLGRVDIERSLAQVSLGEHVLRQRPGQLSGGERQRIAIARGLTTSPEFLVCDEVTSALDVSIQAAIVELLRELQHALGLGILFVTHNLPLVASIADRVVVMRRGQVVESGPFDALISAPRSDYTARLIAAVPARRDGVLTIGGAS